MASLYKKRTVPKIRTSLGDLYSGGTSMAPIAKKNSGMKKGKKKGGY